MSTRLTLWDDLDKILEAFAADQTARSLSPETRTYRRYILRAFFRMTQTEPGNFTGADVVSFLSPEHLSPGTRAGYFNTINAFAVWCKRVKIRDNNPLEDIPAPKEPRRVPRPLPVPEVKQLLNSVTHRRTRAYIKLAYYAGLRVSEIAKIKGEDINFYDETITVIGKGGNAAVLPLHPELMKLAKVMPARGFWFPAHTGTKPHILGSAVTAAIKTAGARAGLVGVTAHRLRHSYGTALVAAGVDLRTAQELLRHASLRTTQNYVATDAKRMRAGVNQLPLI